MHVTYSLLLGIGLLLIFLALTSKRSERARRADVPAGAVAGGWVAALPDAGGRLAFAGAVGVLTAVVTQAFLGWPTLSLASGIVGALVPSWVARQRDEHRLEAVEDAVVEAVAVLRDGSRVGIGLEDGLRSLARTGPLALRPSFRALARDLRLAGFEEAVTRSLTTRPSGVTVNAISTVSIAAAFVSHPGG